MVASIEVATVAPLVGAWVETDRPSGTRTVWEVAPLVGAWVETAIIHLLTAVIASRPSWARGLKPHKAAKLSGEKVAPLVGAWVETLSRARPLRALPVAPLVGAWVETLDTAP